MKTKRCTKPGCGTPLTKSEMESSPSFERWDCPSCGKAYTCPTGLASTSQIASAASALSIVGTFALHLLTMDVDNAVEHAVDNINDLFS